MGLRFRTPIGSLREQRRKAEGLLPLPSSRQSKLRYRNTESLGDGVATESEFDKREILIERLRTVLASESNPIESLSEYRVLQEELARISHHQQANRNDASKSLTDLNVPRTMFFDSSSPFRYLVIDGSKNSAKFADPIAKLDCALVNLDAYVANLRFFVEKTPRSIPLTLLISSDGKAQPLPAAPPANPAHDAATLTHNKVAYSIQPKEKSLIPRPLLLSLLDPR